MVDRLTVTAAGESAFVDFTPSPVSDLHEFSDFLNQGTGWFLTGTSLVGLGSSVTTWRMKPQTDTRPTVGNKALMRCGWTGQKVNLQGFTLQGTYQGTPGTPVEAGATEREYHGLISQGSDGSTITDLIVTGIPGHSSSPTPLGGETASLSLLHGGSHTLTNVQLDGRRNPTDTFATAVAASLFEMNYTTAPMVWNGGRANYARYGFGAALFQCANTRTFTGVDFRFNRKAINIEQDKGGWVRFVGCDFRGVTGASYVAQVNTLGLTVSTKVTFEDCVFDNDLCVVNAYSTAANGGQNGQKDSDIRRIDGGVDVTANAAKFKLTHL